MLARLAAGQRKQAERGARLQVVLPNDCAHVVRRIISLSGIDALFVLRETREDALASMRTKEQP